MWLFYIILVCCVAGGWDKFLKYRLKMKKLDVFPDAKRLTPPTDELAEAFKELERDFPTK